MSQARYILFFLLALLFAGSVNAETPESEPQLLCFKVTDSKQEPVFGVYVVYKQQGILLTTTDIDGECAVYRSTFHPADSIQFQGMGYESVSRCVRDLKDTTVIVLKELKFELQEATVQGISIDELLKVVSTKLQKTKARRIPLCYYYAPARYEKVTFCRDSAIEYRREYGYYFYSGDIKPKNVWDETYRSYLIPEYMAQSYSLTVDGSDTLAPIYLTSNDIRFDVGTRKIYTLIRAVQLFGPLFNGLNHYDIRAVDSDSLYVFSFKTKNKAYPNQVRISCKGTFAIDWKRRELVSMDFDYIDYQLLRQILLTNKRKTSSPFSTRARLDFAYDAAGRNYIRQCRQTTTWKYDLTSDFILIEQPSRIRPGLNKLVEEEAFYCYDQKQIPETLQNSRILTRMHLAFRYPSGTYNAELFKQLPPLLNDSLARQGIGRYMNPEKQFQIHDKSTFYPENYILNSPGDSQSLLLYHQNLEATRKVLFQSFGNCPLPGKL